MDCRPPQAGCQGGNIDLDSSSMALFSPNVLVCITAFHWARCGLGLAGDSEKHTGMCGAR